MSDEFDRPIIGLKPNSVTISKMFQRSKSSHRRNILSHPDMSKKRSQSKPSRKEQSDDTDCIVLGTQMAAAAQAEQQRLDRGSTDKSPMRDKKYDFKRDQMSLLKP